MKKHINLLCVLVLASILLPNESFASWSKSGTQTLTVNSNFYPETTSRYVAPGSKITFDVQALVEKDTQTTQSCVNGVEVDNPPVQVDDPEKQGRLIKSGGTVSGSWTGVFITTGKVTYTVPATATDGQTITIKAQLHDKRGISSSRHDAWAQKGGSWSFTVSSACPTSLTSSIADQSGSRPNAGETYGNWIATMTATGTAPSPRTSWDGTTLTEVVGSKTGTASDWITGYLTTGDNSGSTFTIGSAGTNKFNDTHGTSANGNILASGVSSASYTNSQKYTCSASDKYNFTITRTVALINAPLYDRAKVTITK